MKNDNVILVIEYFNGKVDSDHGRHVVEKFENSMKKGKGWANLARKMIYRSSILYRRLYTWYSSEDNVTKSDR